jgi:hypothetical protein
MDEFVKWAGDQIHGGIKPENMEEFLTCLRDFPDRTILFFVPKMIEANGLYALQSSGGHSEITQDAGDPSPEYTAAKKVVDYLRGTLLSEVTQE